MSMRYFESIISVLIVCLVSGSSVAIAAGLRCEAIYRSEDLFTQTVRRFQNGRQDTTSLRQEVKFVIDTQQLNSYLEGLKNEFGDRFKNRDLPEVGFANITSTNYMETVRYFPGGKKRSIKARFRKYFSRSLDDPNWERLIVSKGLEDKSWLELKIKHPDFENVVFKPRLLILDKDIETITTPKFLKHQNEIARRLKTLNPDKLEEIEKIVDFFHVLYSSSTNPVSNLQFHTAYERTSYSLKLSPIDNANSFIDVQMTLDQNIKLKRLNDGKNFNAYNDGSTVVEVKIPLQYAALSPQILAQVPGLDKIKAFIQWLDKNHDNRYQKNAGKSAHFKDGD